MLRIFTEMVCLAFIDLYHFFLLSNFCKIQGKLRYEKYLFKIIMKFIFADAFCEDKTQEEKSNQ